MSVSFGRRLRAGRLRARYTQEALARALGVTSTTVARWERGEASPPTVAELPLTQEAILVRVDALPAAT